MVGKSKDVVGKESEQVDLLGTKTTVMSKTVVTVKGLQGGPPKGTTKPPAVKTTKKAPIGNPRPPLPINRRKKLEIQASTLLEHHRQIP